MGTDLIQDTEAAQGDVQPLMSPMEIDAIGEVLNISMGSAATAVSSMLDKQVMITTPKVNVQSLKEIDFGPLEPAIIVKITYTEGITGSNVMVFSQRDIQMILNQLMGIEEPLSDDFVFDELSMSAACEVMNQMMGASATALSEFLGKTINISTPTAAIMDGAGTFLQSMDLPEDTTIVSVNFSLSIADIMDTEFVSVMNCDLASAIVSQFIGKGEDAVPEPDAVQQAEASAPAAAPPSAIPPQAAALDSAQPAPQQMAMPLSPGMGAPMMSQQAAPAYPTPPQMPPAGMDMNGQPYYPYPNGMSPYPPAYPYGGYPMPQGYRPAVGSYDTIEQDPSIVKQPVSVKNIQFPEFGHPMGGAAAPIMGNNMDLIMNVPLSISVEIGKAKKKIKEIMDFNQGSIIELEKQAGAPVDIVVNGQLIARGDVVVIDDNFGVRVTEIIGTKELLNSLGNKQ